MVSQPHAETACCGVWACGSCFTVVVSGLLLGPRGSTLKRLEDESGCRIVLRGRGASREGDADEFEALHVVIEASSQDLLEQGESRVNEILFDPEAAQRLKEEQMRQVLCCCLAFPCRGPV